jgi:hypothetical protein
LLIFVFRVFAFVGACFIFFLGVGQEIFNDRKKFREVIVNSVQQELDEVGLTIYNANIKGIRLLFTVT